MVREQERAGLWRQYAEALIRVLEKTEDPLVRAAIMLRIERIVGLPAPSTGQASADAGSGFPATSEAAKREPLSSVEREEHANGARPSRRSGAPGTTLAIIQRAIRENGGAATYAQIVAAARSEGMWGDADAARARNRISVAIADHRGMFKRISRGKWGLS